MQKKPIHRTWLRQNPTKINSFCNQTFHTSFIMHIWEFPTKIAQKPWLQLYTNFATKPKQANPPNLAKRKSNQEKFHLQPNISNLMFDAFVTIPHQDCTKTITSLIHQFYYQDKTKLILPATQTWRNRFVALSALSSRLRLLKNHPLNFSLRCLQMWPAKHTDGASSGRLHSDDQVSPTEPPETGN